MKQLQRLLIQQGYKCFFCNEPIPDSEASVEHLGALSNGGEKTDQNCVACCRSFNMALSNLSVKEKFRAVLSQRASFTCPERYRKTGVPAPEEPLDLAAARELLPEVIENLKKRGSKRPVKLAPLRNAIAGSFTSATPPVIEHLLALLRTNSVIQDDGARVNYPAFHEEA